MGSNLIKSHDNFSFHLNGDSSIDAILLSNTIRDFAELTKIIAYEENPDAFIKLNVTAFENGSFIIDFQTVTEIAENIINKVDNPEMFAKCIVAGIIGAFKIKKFLKGEKCSEKTIEDDSIKIKNKNGDVLVAPKSSAPILYNSKVDNLVINIVNNSNENNNSNGFSLSSSNIESIELEKDDMEFMTSHLPMETEEITRVKKQILDANLKIKKPVFSGSAKWSFIFNGNQIDAKIEDDNWLTTVQEGNININANSILYAQLQIEVELNEEDIPIPETKKFRIIKVYDLKSDNLQHQLTL